MRSGSPPLRPGPSAGRASHSSSSASSTRARRSRATRCSCPPRLHSDGRLKIRAASDDIQQRKEHPVPEDKYPWCKTAALAIRKEGYFKKEVGWLGPIDT